MWPNCQEIKAATRVSRLPSEHIVLLSSFVADYTGICNVNYKIRPCGRVAIFEFNTRVGGDLAQDLDRPLASQFFEEVDGILMTAGAECGDGSPPRTVEIAHPSALSESERAPQSNPQLAPPTVHYLSDVHEETPRYADRARVPGCSAVLSARATRRLLRGANSPAVEVWRARDVDPALHGVDTHTANGETISDDPLRPAVLVLAGGGYTTLAPHEGEPAARLLAEMGLVACVLRYRLPPSHAWPAARDDLFAALDLLRSPEARDLWHVDAGRLAVLGFSAGAHLAAQAARAIGVRAIVLVYPPVSDTPVHVPTLCAVEGDPSAPDDGEPTTCASPNGPQSLASFYVVASTNDRIVPPEQHADIVVDGLRRAGAATEYDRRRLGAHGFGVSRKWTEPCGVWLKRVLQADGPAPDLEASHKVALTACRGDIWGNLDRTLSVEAESPRESQSVSEHIDIGFI